MWFLIFFGAGIILMGLAFIIWMILVRRNHEGTANWPTTSGKVVKSYVYELVRHLPLRVITTYTPVLKYVYTVEGQLYTSQRINFFPYYYKTFEDMEDVAQVLQPYPVGMDVIVHYNPHNPQQATLEVQKAATHNATLWYGVMCVMMGAIGLTLGILQLR